MDKSKTAQVSAEASNEKMLKPKSKSASERKSVLDFRKYTKQIWLAGLLFHVQKKKATNCLTRWSRSGKNLNLKLQILPIKL